MQDDILLLSTYYSHNSNNSYSLIQSGRGILRLDTKVVIHYLWWLSVSLLNSLSHWLVGCLSGFCVSSLSRAMYGGVPPRLLDPAEVCCTWHSPWQGSLYIPYVYFQ